MSVQHRPGSPIYDSLLERHGDVLADVRAAVLEVRRAERRSLDFSAMTPPHPRGGSDGPEEAWTDADV
ncbi:hypothetical protein E1265_08640 [Streptomyces sp. 8K308]|uniref:hypothetical protein n=1 Tax=Streptomyces sp. 8K308 TaxID=2530388 RepID=UPI00104893F1|nr:hypothetical protein [Streptomyces sp. 8K308]TDC24849.1 hypothetical protein E1265_08640 [Streptomyces sp. 8K308]